MKLQEAGIEAVYVTHAKQGYEEHGARVTRLFGEMGMDFEFVSEGDPATFTEELLGQYFCPQMQEKFRNGVISCTLNHIYAYQRMVAREQAFAIIFEDDPFFLGDFMQAIQPVMSEAHALAPGFIISLENTTLTFPPRQAIKKGQHLYPASAGRCAGAYIVDLQGAQSMLAELQTRKCCDIIDWWHNRMIENGVIRMFWAHPALTEQGSHNGMFGSSNSAKSRNITRRIRWNLQKFYKYYIRRLFS